MQHDKRGELDMGNQEFNEAMRERGANFYRHLWAAVAVAIILAALWLGFTRPSKADGCNPQTQDCSAITGSYIPERQPIAEPVKPKASAYSFSVMAAGLRRGQGSECGENITAKRCADLLRRFKAGMKVENERRRQNIRAGKPIRSRDVREARDTYRDERGRKVIVIDDGERRRDREGGACSSRVVIVPGTQHIREGWARNSAIGAWKRLVRYDLGERFTEWGNARKRGPQADGLDCVRSGASANGWLVRCVATAIPCTSAGR
jgi:hypothetical protein